MENLTLMLISQIKCIRGKGMGYNFSLHDLQRRHGIALDHQWGAHI